MIGFVQIFQKILKVFRAVESIDYGSDTKVKVFEEESLATNPFIHIFSLASDHPPL